MTLDSINVSSVNESDLQKLINTEYEKKVIEFNRDLFGNSDSDRKEFLSISEFLFSPLVQVS